MNFSQRTPPTTTITTNNTTTTTAPVRACLHAAQQRLYEPLQGVYHGEYAAEQTHPTVGPRNADGIML